MPQSVCYKMYTTLPLFCRAWYLTRLIVLQVLILHRILFYGVWYPTGFFSAGYQTPPGKLRPCGIRWKSFESLPFPLKGHNFFVCMYKPLYSSHIGSMLKEPPILKIIFCSTGSDTLQNNFSIWISPKIRTRILKCFRVWEGPTWGQFMKKLEAENPVLLYLWRDWHIGFLCLFLAFREMLRSKLEPVLNFVIYFWESPFLYIIYHFQSSYYKRIDNVKWI
jgi:hypothetical protein